MSSHKRPCLSARSRQLSNDEVSQLIQLRARVGGSIDYHIAAAGLPAGPSTVEEFSAWPSLMLSHFFFQTGRAGIHRVGSLLESGLIVHSDCSGKLSPEATWQLLDVALSSNGLQLPSGWLIPWRACDNALTCQEVMKRSAAPPKHIFSGLLEKLPGHDVSEIKDLVAKASVSADLFGPAAVSRVESRQQVCEYLQRRKSKLFGRDKSAGNCIMHPNCQRKLSWQDPLPKSAKQRPLTVAVAGTPCRPFSLHGNSGGSGKWEGHPDMLAWDLWIAEIAEADYDMIFLENGELFVKRLFHDALPDKYKVKFAVFGSQDLGIPVRRMRYYGMAYNQETLAWLGPHMQDALGDFLSFFGKSVSVDGDIFVGLDTQQEYDVLLRGMAENRGLHPTTDQLRKAHWSSLLAPGVLANYKANKMVYEQGNRTGLVGGGFVCDLSQSEDRLRNGPWLPTVARSTSLCSLSKDRLFTANEIDFAMGWPAIENEWNEKYCTRLDMKAMFGTSSHHQRSQLAGNGMMLQQVFSWSLYCFNNLARLPVLRLMELPLQKASTTLEHDEDGHEMLALEKIVSHMFSSLTCHCCHTSCAGCIAALL